ncbi:MAG: FAD-binding oxidoreductase [Eubacteriales bacterium]|nr:FAD-binding oxidoreductase [Eubacteriales bacterium]MDD4140272.1 FAD-binding oxidoreductase [Eubacteriales bacterium]MDD4744435.1 FAD-binding oxidoreductase [Eubacteriales bacterium]
MDHHEAKVSRIARQLRDRKSTATLSRRKKSVSHQVPKVGKAHVPDEQLDIRDFDQILAIDPVRRTCVAEPGVTFAKLVRETLRHGLVPAVVPELKTITIGGAVAGCSIESMSFQVGGFHDTCLAYEVVTAKGDVLVTTPDNEHQLIFQMMHGTFGTLGIITKITFALIPAEPFVHIIYEKHTSLAAYQASIRAHERAKDIDFMDGIIHSPERYVLCTGRFVDQAPYRHRYDWMRIYYLSTASRQEDYLRTPDYFFRYNKGVTNVHPQSFLGRLLFGKLINSTSTLWFANTFKRFLPEKVIPITVDTFIPFSRMGTFMDWYVREVNHFPLWCVPYRVVRRYEWLAEDFLSDVTDELFLDIALYGMRRDNPGHYYRIIEQELMALHAIKTLISTNSYTEEEFWTVWNKKNYDQVKRQTDPDNIFRDLYEKTCTRR